MKEIILLAVLGGIVAQDAIASFCFYDGREVKKNQAFRVARLVVGVLIILIAVSMVD